MNEIDTTNDFLVGALRDGVTILMPPRGPIPKDKALRFAAYIVALSMPEQGEFEAVLQAVLNT